MSYFVFNFFHVDFPKYPYKLKFKIIPKDVTVSARKYEENSYFRVNLANLLLFTSYKVGVSQERLLKLYKFLIKHPKPEVLE